MREREVKVSLLEVSAYSGVLLTGHSQHATHGPRERSRARVYSSLLSVRAPTTSVLSRSLSLFRAGHTV
ncbi:hypothetical protein PUN28_011107 [Cardiocondyla obscurior]|uniref:Uncharacterized protein n=1 Tax=Cardiocondyla obscurior TaxID=286306 RepID=A0AAW2FKR1_9HYME